MNTNTELPGLVFAPCSGEHAPVISSSLLRRLGVACMVSAATAAARTPHPEPRVIVNVTSVHGPHAPLEIQRAARLAWGGIIRCYKAIDNGAKGTTELELQVSKSGNVDQVRIGPSTLDNAELVRCLADTMKGLAMPRASAASTAGIEIRVAPGDKV